MKKAKFEPAIPPEEYSEALEMFQRWYNDEQIYGKDLDPEERHCRGIAQAITAVFHLG